MQYFLAPALIVLMVQLVVAPPVNQKKEDNEVEDTDDTADAMEYRRYLKEVVQALESDPEFRAKLEKADIEEDVRTGKIADQLEFVNHKVRTRLDELKREELERLRHLVTRENQLKNGLDVDHLKIAEHLDHTNTHTFEIQDLKNLIIKTTKDLAEADRKRREQFKEHEMQRKFEEEEKLKHMTEAEKKKYEEELEALKEKHKKHEPVHHPGSKQQLEEVWEKQDHMESEDFNPRTFFFLHDVDGNGVWDQDEVKALFLKELDKLYAQGEPHEDLLKRSEEMERMREHVFNEADLDKDGLISYEEFLLQTKKPNFQQDEGWEGLDEQQIYTQEEFEMYEKQKQEEIQRMIAKGMLPPHSGNIPAQQEPFPPQYVNVPAGHGAVPPQQQFQGQNQHYPPQQIVIPQQQQHPNQVPMQQQHPNQVPMQQQYQHQVPMQQQHPNQVPMQQQHPNQVPMQQQHPNQVPMQQQHPNQVPMQQQQYQGQPHEQQQYQQAQVPPQQQYYPEQVKHHNQLPVQQHPQVPVQQNHPQASNLQQQANDHNTLNQVPKSAQDHASAQQNIPNQAQQQLNTQSAQASVQQEVNRNQIHVADKV